MLLLDSNDRVHQLAYVEFLHKPTFIAVRSQIRLFFPYDQSQLGHGKSSFLQKYCFYYKIHSDELISLGNIKASIGGVLWKKEFFEISLNSQKNTFFTEHLQTTAYGFVLINFLFQGNFTGQKISSNYLMLRI